MPMGTLKRSHVLLGNQKSMYMGAAVCMHMKEPEGPDLLPVAALGLCTSRN